MTIPLLTAGPERDRPDVGALYYARDTERLWGYCARDRVWILLAGPSLGPHATLEEDLARVAVEGLVARYCPECGEALLRRPYSKCCPAGHVAYRVYGQSKG